MILPIKKRYFDLIKTGKKTVELRSAHITFVCEETGETIKRTIDFVDIFPKIDYKDTRFPENTITEDDYLNLLDDEDFMTFRFRE